MYNFNITLTKTPKEKPELNDRLPFGKYFTDHMFIMDYEEGKGWFDPRVETYAPLSLQPATSCLHYAQETFEGMKAYRTCDDKLQLFRPYDNFKRFNNSNARICIPELDVELCVQAVKTLVNIDKDWIPAYPGTSLYIRPFIIAVDEQIGVHPASKYIFMIILSPVGSYYPDGINPVKIYVEEKYSRTSPGGTGTAKVGGNYAASLLAQKEAVNKGCIQVLWLDGAEHKYVDEVGAMNVFFVIGDEVVTPSLNDAILPGITRHSAIEVLRSGGIKVTERLLSIEEVTNAAKTGELREMFGTGTAAVVSPVGKLLYRDKEITINNNLIGSITQKLYDELTGIQTGSRPDKFGWIFPL